MRPPSRSELLALLGSSNPRLVKRGLQRLCDAAEAGYDLKLDRDPELQALISLLRRSPDMLVRRWLYKVIGLSRDPGWVPWLTGQLSRETDVENLSWAIAAFFAVQPIPVAADRIAQLEILNDFPAGRLAARYFRGDQPPLDGNVVRSIIESGSDLEQRWLGLLYGKDPRLVDRRLIGELNKSPQAITSEYSIWALFRDPYARLSDARLYPQDIPSIPPNARRWWYRLLLKHQSNLAANSELITYSMLSDDAAEAREGLALGLVELQLPRHLRESVGDWFEREEDELVLLALMRYIVNNAKLSARFRNFVQQEQALGEDSAFRPVLPSGRQRKSSIFVVDAFPERSRVVLGSAVPRLEDSAVEDVYVLGVDTVDFSSRTDREQVQIFRDLLGALEDVEVVRSMNREQLTCLLTGDGLFLVFRNVRNRHAPLSVALKVQRLFASLRTYELRYGINAGPAAWMALDDGTRQVIGHALNWAARVMAAADGGQILCSGQYFETYLRGSTDEFPGYSFHQVEGLFTKKNEPIPAYEIISPS